MRPRVTFVLWRLTTRTWPLFLKHTNFLVDRLNTLLFEAEYPVIIEYMTDCTTVDHPHKQIEEFKIYRNKNAIPKQKAFSLIYSCYIDFPRNFSTKKWFTSPSFFSDISNVFFYLFKVIHHLHVTRRGVAVITTA